MCNLELGFPRPQLNFCPPDGADQHQTSLRTSEAHATAETKEPRVAHDGTRLFPYLPAKSLLPGLITLGTAPWPPPSLTIIADQHYAPVGGHAETIYPMGLAPRNRARRTPGDQPIAAIRSNRELFAVARDTTLKHSYLHPAVILQFCPNPLATLTECQSADRRSCLWIAGGLWQSCAHKLVRGTTRNDVCQLART
jgi:hypothetical protein